VIIITLIASPPICEHDPCSLYLGAMIMGMGIFNRVQIWLSYRTECYYLSCYILLEKAPFSFSVYDHHRDGSTRNSKLKFYLFVFIYFLY
jgi:hypothetical protein